MRVQIYPDNNLIFIGTQTIEMNLNDLKIRNFIEFDGYDESHPLHDLVACLMPPKVSCDLKHIRKKRKGHCWAQSSVENNYIVNKFYFDNINDILPWHTHDKSNVHTSKVKKGKFSVITENGLIFISEGDFIDWLPNQWHEFIALQENSILLNRVKQPYMEL